MYRLEFSKWQGVYGSGLLISPVTFWLLRRMFKMTAPGKVPTALNLSVCDQAVFVFALLGMRAGRHLHTSRVPMSLCLANSETLSCSLTPESCWPLSRLLVTCWTRATWKPLQSLAKKKQRTERTCQLLTDGELWPAGEVIGNNHSCTTWTKSSASSPHGPGQDASDFWSLLLSFAIHLILWLLQLYYWDFPTLPSSLLFFNC